MQVIQIDRKHTSIDKSWSLGNVSYEISIPTGALEDQIGGSGGEFN